MSETSPQHLEHHTLSPETGFEKHEQLEKAHHIPEKSAEKPQDNPEELKQHARNRLKNESAKIELPRDEYKKQVTSPSSVGKQLKDQALFRTLKNLRQHLSPPERGLSRIVHQPVVDTVSEISGKTVARPSGILGGGICAFLGSLIFLYLAKHTGFRYNYFLFILFFIGGFAVGLILEICIRLAFRFRQRV